MATTETTAFGDGTTILFSFPFPYLKTEDIKVELQRYDSTQTSGNEIISRQTIAAFTVPSNNPTAVQFSAVTESDYQESTGAPKLNFGSTTDTVRVRVFRFTDADSIPSTFIQGSSIRAQDLNNNFEQTLYIMQERQNTIEAIQLGGIGENVISTSALQDDAVTADKLRDSIADDTQRSVTTNHIRNEAITTAKIINDTITTDKIINDAVTTDKIINDAVTTDKIIDDAVTTDKIINDAITTAKIINDAVTTAKILDANVTPAKLSTGGPDWTSSGALGLNGANYGTQYQIAQSNGSGAASTWVNRSTVDSEINLVSSPAVSFKDIAFDTAALAWAKKIDIYFRDVSGNDGLGSLRIKLLDQTPSYFAAGTFVGFQTSMINNTTVAPAVSAIAARNLGVDNAIYLPWQQISSTRYGRITLFKSQSTVWMVDFQATASTNPPAANYQALWAGNGYQVQPASGTGQLGGVQFVFDFGQIDSGAVSIHYS